jgi:hypothetical protein
VSDFGKSIGVNSHKKNDDRAKEVMEQIQVCDFAVQRAILSKGSKLFLHQKLRALRWMQGRMVPNRSASTDLTHCRDHAKSN